MTPRRHASVALLLLTVGCLPEGDLKRPLELTPYDLADDWETASPRDTGLDPTRVRAVYERVFSENEFINAISLLLVHKGRLVAEGYVRDARDATRRDNIQSATKSITALALGVARDDGYFPDLDASIDEFLEVRDPRKHAITLRHLLTMRSGIDVDNDEFAIEVEMDERRHVTQWLLSRPLFAAPGERFDYRDMDPQLVGAIVLAEAGRSLEEVARDGLFAPMGINDVFWQRDADGAPMAAHALWLTPRELAKFGELARQQGAYRGRQLVSRAWVEEATRTQVAVPDHVVAHGYDYGYYFWTMPALPGFAMWGHGGQLVVIVPEAELTLVLTSMPYSGDDIGSGLDDAEGLVRILLGRDGGG